MPKYAKNITDNPEYFGRLMCELVPYRHTLQKRSSLSADIVGAVTTNVYKSRLLVSRKEYVRKWIQQNFRWILSFIERYNIQQNVKDNKTHRTYQQLGKFAKSKLCARGHTPLFSDDEANANINENGCPRDQGHSSAVLVERAEGRNKDGRMDEGDQDRQTDTRDQDGQTADRDRDEQTDGKEQGGQTKEGDRDEQTNEGDRDGQTDGQGGQVGERNWDGQTDERDLNGRTDEQNRDGRTDDRHGQVDERDWDGQTDELDRDGRTDEQNRDGQTEKQNQDGETNEDDQDARGCLKGFPTDELVAATKRVEVIKKKLQDANSVEPARRSKRGRIVKKTWT